MCLISIHRCHASLLFVITRFSSFCITPHNNKLSSIMVNSTHRPNDEQQNTKTDNRCAPVFPAGPPSAATFASYAFISRSYRSESEISAMNSVCVCYQCYLSCAFLHTFAWTPRFQLAIVDLATDA